MNLRYLIILLSIFTGSLLAQSGERILLFDSEITVHENTSMTVRETIHVNVLGQQIKRGIFRDFPTRYRDKLGNQYQVGFEVVSVSRDGAPENFRIENISNGKRIRIGNANTFIEHGEHVYTIQYRTRRQLGLFGTHDELYWNVTGNGWKFPIDEVTAKLHLPKTVDPASVKVAGYTGPQGAVGQNFSSSIDPDQPTVIFATTSPLNTGEGLTIVAGWPTGHVTPPSVVERMSYFLHDNPASSRVLGGLVVVIAYFMIAWVLIGRDPNKGTIIPRFYPPKGLSPAACRFVQKMGFDNTCFAAALISLGVKGVVRIREYKNGVVSVQKLHPEEVSVSPGESALYREMMPYEESMALTQTNHSSIKRGIEALQESLEEEFERHYFFKNVGWFVPGVVVAVLFVVYGIFALNQTPQTFILTMALGGIVGTIIAVIYRAVHRSITITRMVGIILSLIAVTVAAIWVLGAGVPAFLGSVPVVFLATVFTIGLACLLFYELLKRPTIHGRRTMDEVEGFKMYLKTAETDRLAALHPPEKTPELFEKYLPYALALGVQQEWAESFTQMLIAAANNPLEESSYDPGWYHSYGDHHHGFFNPTALTSSISNSLTTSIASASTPPGSSSGFGDSDGGFFSGGGGFSGGFSGGGGGGGGGGGW